MLIGDIAAASAPAPPQIRTICCVCDAHLDGDPQAPLVSHGYCATCVAAILRMDAEAGES